MALSRQSKKNPLGSLGSTSSNSSVPGAPNRISFAKLREPLEVPGLLDVQTDSFEWLIGAPRWREVAAARGDAKPVGGLGFVDAGLPPLVAEQPVKRLGLQGEQVWYLQRLGDTRE